MKIGALLSQIGSWVYWAVRPFFEWFCRYPLLVASAAALLFVICSGTDAEPGYGFQYLFWHHDPEVQFFAGCAVAGFISLLCFVGYLLDACEPWMASADPAQFTRRRRRYLFFTIVLLSAPVVAMWPLSPHRQTQGYLVAGLGAGLVASVIVGWLIGYVSALIATSIGRSNFHRIRALQNQVPQLASQIFEVHVRGLLFFILIAGLYTAFVIWDFQFVKPAVAICLLMGLIVTVYGIVLFHVHVRHTGVLMVLVLGIAIANGIGMYRHQFPTLDYADPVDLTALQTTTRPPVDDQSALKAWRARQRGGKPRLIVIATSGGGLRAAVWTVTVLTELEKAMPDFPDHVRLVTGASGGMLGAAYYVAALSDPADSQASSPEARRQQFDTLIDNIAQDSLSDATRELILRDIPKIVFRGSPYDRGWALERAWTENTTGTLGCKLCSLAPGEQAGWRPSLVFSPTVVETGRRLLVSNLDLTPLTESAGVTLNKLDGGVDEYSLAAGQLFSVLPSAAELSLCTAVRMNASFPLISPDGRLPTYPPRRIVDAGYYDNYGVNLAMLWLSQWSAWLKQNVSGIVLIQIRDEPTEQDRISFVQQGEQPSSVIANGLSWLLTPIDAVFSSRASSMSFRNDEQVAMLEPLFNDRGPLFTTITFELSKPASLSWYLAPNEIANIRNDMRQDANAQNWQRIETLKRWLHSRR